MIKKIKSSTTEDLALKDTIDRLEHELIAANEHILYLQNELEQVSSLKRHIRHFTKKNLKRIDGRIEGVLQPKKKFQAVVPEIKDGDILDTAYTTDTKNFRAFNDYFLLNTRLRTYRRIKRVAKNVLQRKPH